MLPLTGCEPLQPPEAVQNCASLAFHCRVTFCPASTEVGVSCRLTEGLATVAAAAELLTGVSALSSQAASAAKAEIAANPRNALARGRQLRSAIGIIETPCYTAPRARFDIHQRKL